MLKGICTKEEVFQNFCEFLDKHFYYDIEKVIKIKTEAFSLIEDDVDYWADKSLWDLYDETLFNVAE